MSVLTVFKHEITKANIFLSTQNVVHVLCCVRFGNIKKFPHIKTYVKYLIVIYLTSLLTIFVTYFLIIWLFDLLLF